MPCGGAPYGDSNLVFVANDWHTALLPVYLQVRARGVRLRSHPEHVRVADRLPWNSVNLYMRSSPLRPLRASRC